MILVIGHVTGRADTVERMLQLSIEHVLRSRGEPGCISHEVSRDSLQPLRLTFVERWADMPALLVHFRVEASREFAKTVAGLADGAPEMMVYQADAIDLAATPRQKS